MSEKREWIHDFFGGERDLYGTAYTAVGTFDKKDTDKEVDAVIRMLNMRAGSHVLDWCGGWGRHAIPFAKRGFKVTLLDFSSEYIGRARNRANEEGLGPDQIDFVCADFRKTPPHIQADYAVNLFTAGIGYLGEKNDVIALASLKEALVPGAKILIDTMNLFWLMRNFRENSWHESTDGSKWYLEKRRFDFRTNHIYTTSMYRDRTTGEEMSCEEHGLKVYCPADLSRVLQRAGFDPKDLYGDFDDSEFSLTSKRLIMTAQKE